MYINIVHNTITHAYNTVFTYIATLRKICNSTRMAQKVRTNLFLFSRQVLSICMYKTSGNWFCFEKSAKTLIITVSVRLLSWGYWIKSTKQYINFPWGALVCKITPVMWVRSLHRDDVDLEISLVFGILVFDWSIPSMIIVKNFSGDDLAFARCEWYFFLSNLRKKPYGVLKTRIKLLFIYVLRDTVKNVQWHHMYRSQRFTTKEHRVMHKPLQVKANFIISSTHTDAVYNNVHWIVVCKYIRL